MSRTETFTRVSAAHRATSGSSGQHAGSDTSRGAPKISTPAPSRVPSARANILGTPWYLRRLSPASTTASPDRSSTAVGAVSRVSPPRRKIAAHPRERDTIGFARSARSFHEANVGVEFRRQKRS